MQMCVCICVCYPADSPGSTEDATRTQSSFEVFTHLISLWAPRSISTGGNEL